MYLRVFLKARRSKKSRFVSCWPSYLSIGGLLVLDNRRLGKLHLHVSPARAGWLVRHSEGPGSDGCCVVVSSLSLSKRRKLSQL